MAGRRLAGLMGPALVLAGCSALQVDVDVYKGPLLHTPEVQERQYAQMAISAKPVIVRLAEQTKEELKKCGPTCPRHAEWTQSATFLQQILDMYGKPDDLKAANRSQYHGAGIEALTERLNAALALPASDANRELDRRAALVALNDRLIAFAQRILTNVNMANLFPGSKTDNDLLRVQRSVLQSLANTLLVHANDLSRQNERRDAQQRRRDAEVQAVRDAFIVPPAQAFDAIARRAIASPLAAGAPGPAASAPAPAASSAAPDPLAAEKARLLRLQDDLRAAREALSSYRRGLAALIAAHQTLVGDAAAVVPEAAAKPSATEAASSVADRRSIAGLYPAQPAGEADRADPGALEPLRVWLTREQLSGVSVERKGRIALTLQHLANDGARLTAELGGAATRSAVLERIKSRIAQDLQLAKVQDAQLAGRVQESAGETEQVAAAIETREKALRDSGALAAMTAREEAAARRIKAVLESVRSDVLAQADAARVSDSRGVHALLLHKLAGLAATPTGGAPAAEDLALARDALARMTPAEVPVCSKAQGDGLACRAADQLDVVDQLVASLRAQRVRALANGDDRAAVSLQEAINAAYDQRTAMVYLRPASDYLLSVYSASALQDGGEPQFRNMVNDWARYLKPNWEMFATDQERDARRRLELEKLFWQNINRVTLGGGGFTNFVIAKDDVGNWYVKAYSSDPEVIFKSATNLAMFNTGARLNVNLMHRMQLQQRLEDSRDPNETAALQSQLNNLNSQDGRPLLRLRTRYAAQYEQATLRMAAATHGHLADMPAAVQSALDAAFAGAPADTVGSCKAEDMKVALAPVEATHLAAPRGALKQLIDKGMPEAAAATKHLIDNERALADALLGLHGYAAALYKALDESRAAGCSAEWRRTVALSARELPRARLLSTARERRTVVERYEEALVNITETAVQ